MNGMEVKNGIIIDGVLHELCVGNSTDEWYTPKEIIDALGEFDLDPCAPVAPPI